MSYRNETGMNGRETIFTSTFLGFSPNGTIGTTQLPVEYSTCRFAPPTLQVIVNYPNGDSPLKELVFFYGVQVMT